MCSKFIEFFLNKNNLIKNLKKGLVIFSRVLSINKKFVIVDSNLKSESYIPILEFYNSYNELDVKIGNFIETILIKIDNNYGYTVVSRSIFLKFYIWKYIKFLFIKKSNIKCDFINKLKNGIVLNFKGLKCFLPFDNIDKNLFLNFDEYLNKKLLYRIICYNFKKKTIILSRKIVFNNFLNNKKNKFFFDLKINYLIKGIIKNINSDGVYVSFGYLDGFIPIMSIKKCFNKHPNEFLYINQSVLTKILKKNYKNKIFTLKLINFKKNLKFYNLNLKVGLKKFLRIKILSNNFIKLVFKDNFFFYIKKIDFFKKSIFNKLLKKLKINYFIEIFITNVYKDKIIFRLIKIIKFIKPSLAQ